MNAVKLFQKYSQSELTEMQSKLMSNPANRNRDKNSIFIYNIATRRKLKEIEWAIFHHLQAKKK